jgi:4-amino-4-deoxy-L-arabinose transferase-like glycosyltransferase
MQARMQEKNKNEPLLLFVLILAVFVLYFVKLGDFGVTDPGEGYYVEAAREMVESGDFITPHLNYQIYFSKPILTFWLISSSYLCIGVNEFAARLPFAVIALLLFVSCYCLGRCLNGPRCGLFAALIAATTPLMMAFAKLSPIDIAFTAFLDIALFSACLAAIFEKRLWWLCFWFALALAFLTKGPAAIVLSMLGFATFALIERAPWAVQAERLKRLQMLPGLLLFLIVSAPWYLAVANATNGLFLRVFLLYENWARFSGHTNLAHTSWYHYLIVILYGFFPWVFLLPHALLSVFSDRGQPPKTRTATLLLFCWSAAIFTFFSFSKTHLDTYILPTIAPLAVLIACYIERSLALSTNGSKASLYFLDKLLAVLASLFLLGSILLCLLHGRFNNFYLSTVEYWGLTALLGIGAICLGRLLQGRHINAAVCTLFLVLVPVDALLTVAAFKSLDNGGQKQLRELCQKLSQADKGNYRIAIFRTFKPSAIFYTRKPVDSFFHPTQMVAFSGSKLPHSDRQIILVHEKTFPLLVAPAHTHFVLRDQLGEWRAFELIGGEVKSVETLEAMFKNPEAFRRAVSGESDWGPLTVPYGSGNPHWWEKP